jgi:hypothetical protein
LRKHSVVPRPTIDTLPILATLSLETIAEAVLVETFDWTPQMFKQVMGHLGPKQRQFCDVIVRGGAERTEDLQEKLGLKSGSEVKDVIATLRKQLRALGVNPQEVYVAELQIDCNGQIEHRYSSTETFHQIWSEINIPREIKRRGIA